MKVRRNRSYDEVVSQRALLAALSDDLSLPLVQVKTGLELIETENFSEPLVQQQVTTMNFSARAGLRLIEAYKLLLKSDEILNSPLDTLSIGAVLEDVAHQLAPFAQQYSTQLIVDVQGRFAPILAHEPSLNAALEILGSSLIRAQAAQARQKNYRLVLGAHRAEGSVAAGVFSNVQGLSDQSLRAAHNLIGRAHQPLPSIPPGTASGILIADMLCSALWQPLRSAAHKNLGGLATNLPTTSQLQFV